jgi:hypothetical protein
MGGKSLDLLINSGSLREKFSREQAELNYLPLPLLLLPLVELLLTTFMSEE